MNLLIALMFLLWLVVICSSAVIVLCVVADAYEWLKHRLRRSA